MTPTRVGVALAVGVAAVWALQIAWLIERDTSNVLAHDVRKTEYVTALHMKDAAASAVVGRLSKVDKRRGETLAITDVEAVPADQTVIAVFVPADRAWGRALVIGLCVDVWSAGQALTVGTPLKIVSVLPVAGEDKHLVHLLGPTAGGVAGKVLAAKEPAFAFVPCRTRPVPAPADELLL